MRHQHELQAVVDTENVDVCRISENFTRQSYINFNVYKVYHIIHQENSAKGGSVVIIIIENIRHYEETKYEKQEIQVTAVCIDTKSIPVVVVGT